MTSQTVQDREVDGETRGVTPVGGWDCSRRRRGDYAPPTFVGMLFRRSWVPAMMNGQAT
jgi:hypothetical protein